MSDNRKEIVSGIFFIILAIAYFCGTFYIRSYNAFGVTVLSSASVPRALAVALLILGIIQVLTYSFKRKTSNVSDAGVAEQTKEQTDGVNIEKQLAEAEKNEVHSNVSYQDIILTVILLILYTLGLSYLGFVISTVAYIILQTLLMTQKGKRNKTVVFAIVLSVVATAAIYFLFNDLLSLILPAGPFDF